MFRKRRRPTPSFKIPPPYNPMAGDHAQLRQEGTSPFCAMFQVAADDIYDDYVICRGFDTRILRFIDYAEGNADKPGISVAKPFGKRASGTYGIGEVYPALLPTQGNAGFSDFRQVIYTPPSPADVNWRVGQNPGVVTGGLDGGQPEDLDDEIGILYDHNEKVVNWLLIDGGDGGGEFFELLEDMPSGHGAWAYAELNDWNGNLLKVVKLYNWRKFGSATGILDGALPGYPGFAKRHRGRWIPLQGAECKVTCSSDGSITGAAGDGTVGTPYTFTPAVANLNAASASASGLPPGLSIDTTTAEITGTPTTAGDYAVTVTATSPKTGAGATGDCTITRYFPVTIAEAE